MNKNERANLVRAMDLLARSANDETIAYSWLLYGVADGDVDGEETDEELECYYEDDNEFSELIDLFLATMERSRKNGIYCDGVTSGGSYYVSNHRLLVIIERLLQSFFGTYNPTEQQIEDVSRLCKLSAGEKKYFGLVREKEEK